MRQWTAWLNWPSRDWGRGRAGADVSSQHGKPNFTAVAGIGAVGDAIDSIKLRRSTFLRHDLNAIPVAGELLSNAMLPLPRSAVMGGRSICDEDAAYFLHFQNMCNSSIILADIGVTILHVAPLLSENRTRRHGRSFDQR